ncbi:MAG: integrin alpha [Planctomycetes bacterium]|nr:integrin alpha [Planctomycetota bacterium]
MDDFIMGCPGDDLPSGAITGHARVCSGADGSTIYDVRSPKTSGNFGMSVANAGDTNGDGVEDFIVGAPGEATVALGAGAAHLFSGKDGSVLFSWFGDTKNDEYGVSVGGGGDIDGDGFCDLIVGSHFDDKTGLNTGSVYVYSGLDGKQLYLLTGGTPSDLFGHAVANAGDVDHDGRADILIGVPYADAPSLPNTGKALVVSGATGAVLATYTGTWPGGRLGFSVASAGDTNADGVLDVIVGAPDESVTAFRSGSAYAYSGADGTILGSFHGVGIDDFLGCAVSAAGDANMDGYADVVAGAYVEGDFHKSGAAHVYSGRDGSLLFKVFGDVGFSSVFGITVSGGGDMNGDGFDDIVVGAPDAQVGAFFDGAAYVYSPCPLPPMSYCTAKVNSQGCAPVMQWSGTTSLADPDVLELHVANLIAGQPAFLILGAAAGFTPWQGNTLCVTSITKRISVGTTRGNPSLPCSGSLKIALADAGWSSLGLGAGATTYLQVIARDPGLPPPDRLASTSGLRLILCP